MPAGAEVAQSTAGGAGPRSEARRGGWTHGLRSVCRSPPIAAGSGRFSPWWRTRRAGHPRAGTGSARTSAAGGSLRVFAGGKPIRSRAKGSEGGAPRRERVDPQPCRVQSPWRACAFARRGALRPEARREGFTRAAAAPGRRDTARGQPAASAVAQGPTTHRGRAPQLGPSACGPAGKAKGRPGAENHSSGSSIVINALDPGLRAEPQIRALWSIVERGGKREKEG